MKDRLRGMILATARARILAGKSAAGEFLNSDLKLSWPAGQNVGARFLQALARNPDLRNIDRVVAALWETAISGALAEPETGHHLQFWFSEHIRAWMPDWVERAEADGELDLRADLVFLRQRIQDVFSLGINLRQREAWELDASLNNLRADPSFRSPSEGSGSELLWRFSLTFAAAAWGGRQVPKAIDRLLGQGEGGSEAAEMLSTIAGVLYGERHLVEEFRFLGVADIESEFLSAEKKLKDEGPSVEERVDRFLS